MPKTTPREIVSLQRTYASHVSWAQTADRTKRTAPARAAFQQKFLDEVDPDGVMTPAQREQAAESARKAFYARLALLSAAARRKKAS